MLASKNTLKRVYINFISLEITFSRKWLIQLWEYLDWTMTSE